MAKTSYSEKIDLYFERLAFFGCDIHDDDDYDGNDFEDDDYDDDFEDDGFDDDDLDEKECFFGKGIHIGDGVFTDDDGDNWDFF